MLEHLKLTNVLFIDIETVPQYADYHLMPENLKKLWDKKSSYQRKNDETAEEFYPRAGIWAEFGKIICISAGIFSSEKVLRIKSVYGDDEKTILQEFSKILQSQPSNLILCAHNGKEFDFPYLCRRMLINNIKIPVQLNIIQKKPWEINHIDTLELWKFGDFKTFTSLELLATIFDIPTPKDDIDGSMVSGIYYNDHDLERINRYCQKDVITIARLLQKFKGIEIVKDEDIVYV